MIAWQRKNLLTQLLSRAGCHFFSHGERYQCFTIPCQDHEVVVCVYVCVCVFFSLYNTPNWCQPFAQIEKDWFNLYFKWTTLKCALHCVYIIVRDAWVRQLAYSVFFTTVNNNKRGREREEEKEKRREGRSAVWQMSPKQLPPQNTIALTTTGMEREEKERLRKK